MTQQVKVTKLDNGDALVRLSGTLYRVCTDIDGNFVRVVSMRPRGCGFARYAVTDAKAAEILAAVQS